MSEESARSFELETIDGGTTAVHRLHFIQNGKKIGHEDFRGDGTKDGHIDAMQDAQNKGENWVDLGEK